MSNSIGHGYTPTDEPNLSKLNKQAKSLVAIAADCGWRVRQNPLGMVVLETGHTGGEHGYRQIVVPTTSTRGPWAISNLRKVLLYGTRNTGKYQAGLAELGDKALQLSELIQWAQTYDPDTEPTATEPDVLPVEITSRDWDADPQPAAVTAEGQGLLDELLPAPEPEPERVHVPDEPDLGPPADLAVEAAYEQGFGDGQGHPEPDAAWAALVASFGTSVQAYTATLTARIAELEAELAAERAKRQELEDNLNALGDLIGQIRRT